MGNSRLLRTTALICSGAAAAVIAASPWAGATGGRAQARRHAGVTAATPISSAAYLNLVIADARKDGLSERSAHRLADCLVREYTKYGAKTVGDLQNNQPAANKIARACGTAVGIVGKLERAKAAGRGRSSSSSGTPAASPAKASSGAASVTG